MGLKGIIVKIYLVSGKHTDHPFKKTFNETVAIDSDNHIDTICTCTLQCFAIV
jgi:hypothetical protein